ncbi:N-formylglutamate amidohydrolase [Photobacterium sp. J15]|uniref:N-formylglutamate amidohydrolase n=1 Tax=Photobacterium sp. J15 TaxID=265901 RepID=UPI0007E3D0E3|nr:N-formylglutamate amidohydrolase [Photobacterium sp. J15]
MKSKDSINKKNNAWVINRGTGPIVATAIHSGHQLRPEIAQLQCLEANTRLREEDPFTDLWTRIVSQRVVVNQSRFEFDLNRTPETCVYESPDDAWGLVIYNKALPDDVRKRSQENYSAFYDELYHYYDELKRQYHHFVILDLHSYNHKRNGPEHLAAEPNKNPEINIGTGTLTCAHQWRELINNFINDLRQFDYLGRHLDVRENIKFVGRNFGQWTHHNFAGHACCLSIEVKKIFMDEWTGELDPDQHQLIQNALASTIPGIHESLNELEQHHE